MGTRRRFSPLLALLLAAPLVALAAWIAAGGLTRSFGPAPPAAPPAAVTAAASAPRPAGADAGLPRIPGFDAPTTDLPPERFWERVNGAADALIAAGCRRMVAWRAAAPPAEVELLVFETAAGAASFLVRDAGPGRTPGGPGDEASVAADSIFFRRGRHYVRVLADAAVAADHAGPRTPAGAPGPATILDLARIVDSALVAIGTGVIP